MDRNEEGGAVILCGINNKLPQIFEKLLSPGIGKNSVECVKLSGDSDKNQVCTLTQFFQFYFFKVELS